MAIEVFSPEYIAKVGFPIAAFVAAFGVVTIITTLIIKSQIKRQEKLDSQYFTNLYSTLDKYDKSLKEIHEELVNVVVETRTILTKIDICRSRLDRYSDNKSVTYVFREGKIGEIKNIIEEREVMRDIERNAQDTERKSQDKS